MGLTKFLLLVVGLFITTLALAVPSWSFSFTNTISPVPVVVPLPTDASIAIGNGFTVVDQNQQLTAWKGSTQQTWTNGLNFWTGALSWCNDQSSNTTNWCNVDPRIIYDPVGQRWIATAVTHSETAVLLGVSTSSDPTGTWQQYPLNGCDLFSSYPFEDFPRLAINNYWIVWAVDCFNSTGTIGGEEVHVFSRTSMESGNPPANLGSSPFKSPLTGKNDLYPVNDVTASNTSLFFVNPVTQSGGFKVNVWQLVGGINPIGITSYASSNTFSVTSAQTGGSHQLAPLVPSYNQTYWLAGQRLRTPCSTSNMGASLNWAGVTGSADSDTWAGGNNVIEFIFNGKYGGSTAGGFTDGGVYMALVTFNVTTATWNLERSWLGDPSGFVERSYPAVGHKLIGTDDWQMISNIQTGSNFGLDVDSTDVQLLKNGMYQTEQLFLWPTGSQVVTCGRLGDYSAVAADPSSNTLWYNQMVFPSTGQSSNSFGSISLSALITSPIDGVTVSGRTVSFAESVSSDVVWTNFYVDGGYVSSSPPYNFNWDSTTVPNGTHTLSIKAYNGAGAQTGYDKITVNVQNTVVITAPANNTTVSGTAVTISIEMDPSVVWSNIYIDGGYFNSTPPTSFSWNSTTVANGSHTISANAYNSGDQVIGTDSITVTVSN